MYGPNNGVSESMKHTAVELKEEVNLQLQSNTPLPVIDRKSRQKMSEHVGLNIICQVDQTYIYRTFHSKQLNI